MRPISIITWVTVLAIVGFGTYRFSPWFKGDADKQPKFETAELTRGAITAKVTASGTLSALVTVQVGSQVSGRIKKLYVDYNSEVKKGQVIAKLGIRALLAGSLANLMSAALASLMLP